MSHVPRHPLGTIDFKPLSRSRSPLGTTDLSVPSTQLDIHGSPGSWHFGLPLECPSEEYQPISWEDWQILNNPTGWMTVSFVTNGTRLLGKLALHLTAAASLSSLV
jgi:hypothetical protein